MKYIQIHISAVSNVPNNIYRNITRVTYQTHSILEASNSSSHYERKNYRKRTYCQKHMHITLLSSLVV
ncbi:hypothetical protein Hanom_Chr09g00836721 [Helianthus anomalus]